MNRIYNSSNEDFLITIILALTFALLIIVLIAYNESPDKIKDTNCIHYNNQIFCLKEDEENERKEG